MKPYEVGNFFPLQFSWRLPDGDLLRTVFEARVVGRMDASEKYVVTLDKWLAGRQEDTEGSPRPREEIWQEYWQLAHDLAGSRISVAYEAADGRVLPMRLATLTGEHNFFRKLNALDEGSPTGTTDHSGLS